MRNTMGIDVSQHNGKINWPMVKSAGVEFAILRASCGFLEDTEYRRNAEGAAAAGIATGTYGYYYPYLDPIKQAQILSDLHNLYPHLILPAGDLEENPFRNSISSKFKIPERLHRWDSYMTTLDAGQKAALCWEYISSGYWNTYMFSTSHYTLMPAEVYRAMLHPLWQPAYRQGLPDQFYPFLNPLIQQFTSAGRLPGILTNVDINRTLLTVQELGQMGRTLCPTFSPAC